MRQPSFHLGNTAKRTLFVSGIGLAAVGLLGCDPKAESLPTGPVGQALRAESGSPGPVALRPAHVQPSRPSQHPLRVRKTDGGSGPSLRAAYIRSVQGEGGRAYQAQVRDGGEVAFSSQEGRLSMQAGRGGLRFTTGQGRETSSATFRFLSYGCAGERAERAADVGPVAQGHRIQYRRGDLVEWYQNGRLGVEQGFDLQGSLGCRGVVELKLAIDHSLRATLSGGADAAPSLSLRDEASGNVLHYSDLFAVDADGKSVPVELALSERGTELALRVDDRGARYPLTVDPLIWAQVGAAVKAGDPDANDHFGFAVAAAGDTAVVGAPLDDEGGTDAGALYVFTLGSQGTWSQRVKVTGPAAGARYGHAVAVAKLSGGDYRIVVGAPEDSAGAGLAGWFRGAGDTWTAEAEFSGAGAFGHSVGVSGDRVIVGAYGEGSSDGVARIYEPDPRVSPIPWNETATITDVMGSGGQLGVSVAIDGDYAVVGQPSYDVAASNDGRAFVYQRNPAGAWTRVATLVASDRAAGASFGYHVALSGLSAVIGAPGHNSAAGAAYVFSGIAGTWAQTARLHTLAGVTLTAGDEFGRGPSIVGSLLSVGAPKASAGMGTAYLFSRAAGGWSLSQTFAPKGGGTGDFANATTLGSPGHILAGSHLHGSPTANSGAFFDFVLRKQNGDACAAAGECASDFCVDGVCCNSACGGGVSSDCEACSTAMGAAVNGTCAAASNTTVCRPAAGACDVAETCDGTASACPADVLLPSTSVCRTAVGACDAAESCTGTSAVCPADAVMPVQTVCRPAAGDCDMAELCDGQTKVCPADLLKPSFTLCRLPASECDQAEVCSGLVAACPEDITLATGTPCAAGSCQAGGVCRIEADLGVSLSGPPTVQPQQDLVYTATVSNFGRSAATNVSVDITLPANAPVLATSWRRRSRQASRCRSRLRPASIACRLRPQWSRRCLTPTRPTTSPSWIRTCSRRASPVVGAARLPVVSRLRARWLWPACSVCWSSPVAVARPTKTRPPAWARRARGGVPAVPRPVEPGFGPTP
jgi:uncharacterized repeat protein (TIGR01451 family)